MYSDIPPADDEELPALLARWQSELGQGDIVQRRAAAEGLYDLARDYGEQVAPALPALVSALADEDAEIGDHAGWALKYLAPMSVAPLVRALAHTWPTARERAASSLGNIGEEALAAAPALRQLLADEDVAASSRAAWALGLIGDTSMTTLDLLWGLAAEGSTLHRSAALHALGNLGSKLDDPAGWPAPRRPLVLAALADPDSDLRWSALYAAESLRLANDEWADLLASVLARETSDQVLDSLLRRLGKLAGVADLSALLPELLRLLGEPGRRAAKVCDVLGAMRPAPLQALPALHAALAREDIAFAAAQALWRIQPDAATLLPVLERLFDDHDEEVCDLVCEMGPAAAPLLPRLLAALASESWDLQWAAADALAAIAPADAQSQRALLSALGHDSPRICSGAARALALSGPVAVPALQRLVADAEDDRSAWAAFALGLMGEGAAEALGELRLGMHAAQPGLACACQIAVARIGSLDSLDLLIALLNDPEAGRERADAAEAVGLLGPPAQRARAALQAASASPDTVVADAAQAALEHMDSSLQ